MVTIAQISSATACAPSGWCARVASPDLPTASGRWKIHAFHYELEDQTHVALVMGEPSPDEPMLVRVHSECLTGDVFGSMRCDCGAQLQPGDGARSRRRARA